MQAFAHPDAVAADETQHVSRTCAPRAYRYCNLGCNTASAALAVGLEHGRDHILFCPPGLVVVVAVVVLVMVAVVVMVAAVVAVGCCSLAVAAEVFLAVADQCKSARISPDD